MSAPGDRPRVRTMLTAAAKRPDAAWLGARMLGWRVVLPVLRRALPLRSLVSLVWPSRRSRRRRRDREALVAATVSQLYGTTLGRADDNCLERCLLAYRFLAQVGAEPELECGVRRVGGELRGHAWIVVDGRPLAHADEGIQTFTPIATFGHRGALIGPPG
jgi:hypothetical protein